MEVPPPVDVRWSRDQTRLALRLFHPTGNILTAEMMIALRRAIEQASAQPQLKLIVLEAEGPDFSFGASVPEHAPGEIDRVLPVMHETIYALLDAPAITAAVVRGRCLGGGFELALACDIRIAGRAARFAGVGVKLGLTVSTARLTRACGEGVALDLLLTGRTLEADEAFTLGLVSAVADDAELGVEARRWAEIVASRAPLSVRANKVGLVHCARLPIAEAITYERGEWARLQRTRDHKEALAAFFAKRAPLFTGE